MILAHVASRDVHVYHVDATTGALVTRTFAALGADGERSRDVSPHLTLAFSSQKQHFFEVEPQLLVVSAETPRVRTLEPGLGVDIFSWKTKGWFAGEVVEVSAAGAAHVRFEDGTHQYEKWIPDRNLCRDLRVRP
jgi:hypothetical protein